jgi:hypothetical protein
MIDTIAFFFPGGGQVPWLLRSSCLFSASFFFFLIYRTAYIEAYIVQDESCCMANSGFQDSLRVTLDHIMNTKWAIQAITHTIYHFGYAVALNIIIALVLPR